MGNLQDLQKHRKNILLAEVAAWLHDWKKCSDEHIKVVLQQQYNSDRTNFLRFCPGFVPHRAEGLPNPDFANRFFTNVANLSVNLCGTNGNLVDLVREGRRGREDTALPHLIWLLRKCHHSAHIEKEKEDNELEGIQCTYNPYPSSPFGFEGDPLSKLTNQMQIDGPQIRARDDIFKIQFLRIGLGDTRRSINEVTLWDWSSIVAALYKAEIARCVLTGEQREPKDVQWRLLSIHADGLEYLFSALSIPDLKARQELLRDAWDKVQHQLEETYPLGLEVYRDENGPVFVVPDIENLLALTDSDHNHKTLREFILQAFRQGTVQNDPCLALGGEIVPYLKLDKAPWDGQSKLPPIGQDHLKEIPPLQTDPQWVAQQWCNLPRSAEVCTVCGLRPQGPSPKARSRGRCDVCEKRREARAKAWAANIGRAFLSTIWLDEVADRHGRIALLVGAFDLTHWLDGTLVRSLAVRTPNDQNGHTAEDVAKNPSFARLRRIWETTRRFWEETLKEAKGKLTARPRLFLKGSVPNSNLGPYHAYELDVQGRKVAVLWVPEDATDDKGNALEYRGGFWVIENLDYLDKVYGRSFHALVQSLADQKESLAIYEPTEYGRPGETRATFTISADGGVQPVENAYLPLIPILAEPRTFMALVPADKAFAVLKAIKAKYEREMGKVRNRLPLHLGVVFADAHQPLRTLLDAGRRMLKQKEPEIIWEVRNIKRFGQPNHPNETKGWRALRFLKQQDLLAYHPNQFRVMVGVHLRNNGRDLIWHIPAVMGDGQTEDQWYPYVFLADCGEPSGRPDKRYFLAQNPWNASHSWLIHASALQPGDRIYFTPATFDFQWLAAGSDRFGIAYDEQGRRQGLPRRPYLLDDLETLEHIWNTLKEPTSESQIHALVSLIEAKREEWQAAPEDKTFRRFCRDVLVNLEWQTDPWQKGSLDAWVDYAAQGWLTDAVEIFHGVMKERTST